MFLRTRLSKKFILLSLRGDFLSISCRRIAWDVLNSNSILTASHCVFENSHPIVPERVIVHLGKYSLKISSGHTQEFESHKVIPHPSYNPSDLSNDIAIIRLSTKAIFDNYVQPICLWDSKEISSAAVIGKFGIVIGWGVTETDKLSHTLRQAVMPVVSTITCLTSNRDFFGQFLTDYNFCAGFRNGTSVCNGDSGGSITFEENGVYRIRGLVSASKSREDKQLCNSQEYVIFTDVEKYLPWIRMVVPQLKKKSEIISRVKTNSGKKFLIETSFQANWFKAFEYCSLHQMRLATILSQEEQDAVVNLIFDEELIKPKLGAEITIFWTSGTDLGSYGNYVWLSIGQPFRYTKWWFDEPNQRDNNEHCIDINIDINNPVYRVANGLGGMIVTV